MKTLIDHIRESLLDKDFDITDNDINPLLGIRSIGGWVKDSTSPMEKSIQIDSSSFDRAWLVGLNKNKVKKWGFTHVPYKTIVLNGEKYPIVVVWDRRYNAIRIILRSKYSLIEGDEELNAVMIQKNRAYILGTHISSCGRIDCTYYLISEELLDIMLKNIKLSYKKS